MTNLKNLKRGATKAQFKIGEIVRSIINPNYLYKVVGTGHGYVYLVTSQSGYQQFTCRASVLRRL